MRFCVKSVRLSDRDIKRIYFDAFPKNENLVVKPNSSHSARKGLICDFEYIW